MQNLNTPDQLNLTGIHRTLLPITTERTFSGAHGTFSVTDHKRSLDKFETELYKISFLLTNGMKLEIKSTRETENSKTCGN